ncbi:hypothetical protein HID58_054195 [Brassica napus]|uniref:RNase H type-1 domain-containing protein n=1 Tax=Brassica napus TaxID=3708 RepID=A0ABQ8AGX6_BRANA|nr:hypothetical protein HID58_054195 [Brassica napus]
MTNTTKELSTRTTMAWIRGTDKTEEESDDGGVRLSRGSSNFTSKRRHVPSALVAEALALKTAVSTAVLRGATSLVVSSDSKTLINLLVVKENHLHVQGILFDIHRLCSTLIFVYFQFVPRNANSLADALAKSALCALKNSPCVDE